MARLAFDDEYVAVDVDPAQLRAQALNLTVSRRVRDQLAALWGPSWRAELTGVLAEVSEAWQRRSSWLCVSNDNLIVLSASGRCVVAVQPGWWNPDELRASLADRRFDVAPDVEARWAEDHGESLWPEVLEAATARLARTGQFEIDRGRPTVSAGRLMLWLRPGDPPTVIGGRLRLPDREGLRAALRAGDVTASSRTTTRLRDQFGNLWHDVLVTLCHHLVDARIPARAREVSISDDTGAGMMIQPGPLVTKVYFGQANTNARIWSPEEIRATLADQTYRVSRTLQRHLSDQLGPTWNHHLASTCSRLAAAPTAPVPDQNGKILHLVAGDTRVTVQRHTPIDVTLDGRTFPTTAIVPWIVDASLPTQPHRQTS